MGRDTQGQYVGARHTLEASEMKKIHQRRLRKINQWDRKRESGIKRTGLKGRNQLCWFPDEFIRMKTELSVVWLQRWFLTFLTMVKNGDLIRVEICGPALWEEGKRKWYGYSHWNNSLTYNKKAGNPLYKYLAIKSQKSVLAEAIPNFGFFWTYS